MRHYPSTPQSAPIMSDVLHCVTLKDAAGLRHALENGWVPPKIDTKVSGAVDNWAVWTECLLSDWPEGLALLHEFHPHVSSTIGLWNMALRHASHKCISLLWTMLDAPQKATAADRNQWMADIMVAMGEPWSFPHEISDTLPVVQFLALQGVPLDGVAPGGYVPHDMRYAGHSLFTRSVALKRWDHVDLLWPATAVQARAWPRSLETIERLMMIVVGDYVSTEQRLGAVLQKEPATLLTWLKMYGAEWIAPTDHTVLSVFDSPGDPVHVLARPTSTKINPWLRLPLVVAPEHRPLLWSIWNDVLERDVNKAWLMALAMFPQDADVIAVMARAQADAVPGFVKHWCARGPDGQLSPHDVWMESGGAPETVAWCSVAQPKQKTKVSVAPKSKTPAAHTKPRRPNTAVREAPAPKKAPQKAIVSKIPAQKTAAPKKVSKSGAKPKPVSKPKPGAKKVASSRSSTKKR